MWSITFQLMKKNARMLVPAGIAILVGSAFIAGTYLFGNAMRQMLYGDGGPLANHADETQIVTTFLLAFGILALLVAALVIANTFQVLVAQRRRTLALLRTIGAKSGQLYRSVVLEAALLGLIASALGVLAGWGAMAAVSAVVPHLGGDFANIHVPVILSWQVVVIPIAFGTVVTMLASCGAARSATAVSPLEALRPIDLSERASARRGRAVIGTLLLVVGVALAVYGAVALTQAIHSPQGLSDAAANTTLLSAVAGCGLTFIGLVVTATFWMPVLMKGACALVSRIGPSSAVAAANVRKNPRRIAATGTALLIGVTLVSTIATGAATLKATMGETLDSRYSVDFALSGATLTETTTDKLASTEGVEASVSGPTAYATMTDDGHEVGVLLVGVPSVDALASVMHTDLSGVTLDSGQVLLQSVSAVYGTTFAGGTTATFDVSSSAAGTALSTDEAADATKAVTLSTETRDFRSISTMYARVGFVNESMFADGTLPSTGRMVMLRLAGDSSAQSATIQRLTAELGDVDGLDVTGPVVMRMIWNAIIDKLLLMLVALLAVAVLIALIGVANTLSLSVIERTRESATLRAIGMTKGQLRRSLAVEALVISVTSSITGLVVGTAFGFLGSYMVMSSFSTLVFTVDWGQYGLILLVAVVAALLASVFPARRATKTSPVEALAEA
ncbi:FtsX-like permease family protein [Bifidobacterium sp. BRDM6]|uniref:FtsX-like permease family protein n=1 Tax=Bifidobacterium choloepi TaxID=2614131 RepID=A0A6I5NCC2_9BIFI|nr:FtsX-like permease family protein [Bifidobacterium choloepi]NEG70180.1 FtsX-like permease family protein [Bifidobacterium choloepi]